MVDVLSIYIYTLKSRKSSLPAGSRVPSTSADCTRKAQTITRLAQLCENQAATSNFVSPRADRRLHLTTPSDPSRQSIAMSSTTKQQKPKAGRSAISDVVAREYTIHLHKRVGSV